MGGVSCDLLSSEAVGCIDVKQGRGQSIFYAVLTAVESLLFSLGTACL